MQKNYLRHLLCTVLLGVSFTLSYAQTGNITGTVSDQKNESVPGVSVVIKGTTQGGSTDINGKYRISKVAPGKYEVVASFIGYKTISKEVTVAAGKDATVDFSLEEDAVLLNEAVAIGYGTTQKKDLTGTVTSVSSKDFNKGTSTTPEQLIAGKVAGVQITSNGGAPGSGSRIRIRGGASVNASNDPLIVIDGVPVDNGGISGSANPLSLINPNDIENMTVLKDASAAAIYGSRASNGVIIITTKRGATGKLKINFNTSLNVSSLSKYTGVLSADQFRKEITDSGTTNQKKLLGNSVTNWQSEIYRTAVTSDNNISFTGGIKNLPYYLSFGAMSNAGVLERSQMDRFSVALNVNPTFFEDRLSVDINTKYTHSKSFFANQDAIGGAVGFDPTQSVYSDTTAYGGYFEWLDPAGKPITVAGKNPVGLIYQKEDNGTADRFIGNAALGYKLGFAPGLSAHLNLGLDVSKGKGDTYIPETAAAQFFDKGSKNHYEQDKTNQLLEFYMNYTKDFTKIKSKLDFTAGYSYQYWETENPFFYSTTATDSVRPNQDTTPGFQNNALISFYGRLNYTFAGRFLLTATLRNDLSSRFSESTRSGFFPSVAFAYRISDEKFLQKVQWISNLKIRVSYGETGQQDINNNYPYIANYSQGTPTAQYQFGSAYYYVLRPDAYDSQIKWEETATTNLGLDFGFFNGRINGSFDLYDKQTSDLLVNAAIAAGTNFGNVYLTNIGDMENKGFEFNINFIPVLKDDFTWSVGFNMAHNVGKITGLPKLQGENDIGIKTGGIAGGIGNTIQVYTVGYAPNSFYVYQQVYNDDGSPKEGIYVDQNSDGKINENDLIRYKKPDADYLFGFNTSFQYKNWGLSTSIRAQTGNYMYNNVYSNQGSFAAVGGSIRALSNLSENYLETKFKKAQYFSDYYVQDASFVRMDYVSLSYNLNKVFKDKMSATISANVQNVFVITDYKGLDPEIASGIDNNIYPRPHIYSLSLNLQF